MTSWGGATGVEGSARPGRRPKLWDRLARSSKGLIALSTCLMLVAAAGLGLMIWQLHEDALTETRQNIGNLGTAISEQTARAMQAGDLVLEDLRRQIGTEQLNSVAEFKARLANRELFGFLKDRADFLPQVDAFTVIAADGKLVNFSRQWPIPPTDLSDRDYVAYFRTHDTPGVFISAPVQNRGTGGWTSYLVRRINAPSGEFIGLVLAAVDLTYFQDFFKAASGKAETTVTLLRSDGIALSSYPPTAKVGEALPPASPWFGIVPKGPGVFETKGVLAPGLRIVSVHPLYDYPLVINVSVAKTAALADWSRISIVAVLFAVIAIGCVMLLIRAQMRQFGRLEASETQLEHRNATLEAAQNRLKLQTEELTAGRVVMAQQSATLEAALGHMNQGILVVSNEGTVAVCNGQANAMLDLPPELTEQRPSFGALLSYQRSIGEFDANPASPGAFGFEEAMARPQDYEHQRPDGTILQVQTVPMRGGGLVRTYTDITERRRSELQVQFLASHDALTGLLNRSGFHERFDELLTKAERSRLQLAVFYIDLDGFKLVNDTHGHAIGDELLVAVGQRLRSAVRDSDLVVRMGGDEFAVVKPLSSGSPVAELASRMIASVAGPFRFEETQCSVSLSIGVALYPDHADSTAGLLQSADTALYRAKAAGKRTFCIFDPVLDRGEQSLLLLEQDLGKAVANQELFLEYQPIVDADTLEVVRFEALLRWTHPVRGRVMPGEIIAVAERSGLIVPIGLWVIETACAAAAAWPWPVEVSVNLSPVQFARADLVSQIGHILQRTGLVPRRLNLEITEGVLLENTSTVRHTVANLRQIGVRFSLDDFGTAHAGLTYLRSFAFDVLKIDKSFVQDAARSPEARGILGAIRALGAACNLQVVAEGVETEAELELVRELRCDHVQGYLTGRPSATVSIDNTGLAQPVAARLTHLRLVRPS